MTVQDRVYTSVEICAGAGGQAVGLDAAGFRHLALIEIDPDACQTLRDNIGKLGGREGDVHQRDLKLFTRKRKGKRPEQFTIADLGLKRGEVDLLAGGVPCPPFSVAGQQLGQDDERDLFPVMLEMVDALDPKAVMIENVRGLLEPKHKFAAYRAKIEAKLSRMGYTKRDWKVLEAKNFGVPQLRPRAILVAVKGRYAPYFDELPESNGAAFPTVADALRDSMKERYDALRGTEFAERAAECYERWLEYEGARKAAAPTLVGGSKKHGGADLGPTRAKRAWKDLGVNALGVADEDPMVKPGRHLLSEDGPMLTVPQAAIIQGFPEDWKFSGRKTAAYRQVGNAFPPPVAEAVGKMIIDVLKQADKGAAPPAPRCESDEPVSAPVYEQPALLAL
ncbi:DNA cytosine methyltransferase [Streptomyces sp. RPT161]|uniref:DNA cytosine methyltransferase n=1 Tax=Streptomyces sp. RPT161 TaxID=3015993 RepID=UPI0022B9169F|nr:DNA (cytosine-5-)-methyltransferase [Streptomyces sp. RPT161]